MCIYDHVLFTHRVEEGMGNLLRGAVYTKIQVSRGQYWLTGTHRWLGGRCGAVYNIHERLKGQYVFTAKHVIRGCGME